MKLKLLYLSVDGRARVRTGTLDDRWVLQRQERPQIHMLSRGDILVPAGIPRTFETLADLQRADCPEAPLGVPHRWAVLIDEALLPLQPMRPPVGVVNETYAITHTVSARRAVYDVAEEAQRQDKLLTTFFILGVISAFALAIISLIALVTFFTGRQQLGG